MRSAARAFVVTFFAVTCLLVIAAVAGRQAGQGATLSLLVAGVVVLGLPHGALDPQVAAQALADWPGYSPWKFYATYLALVLAYGVAWVWMPNLGVASFLAIAAAHFGSDWEHGVRLCGRLAYGIAVVTLPAVRFSAVVQGIYAQLGAGAASTMVHISALLALAAVLIAVAAAASAGSRRWGDVLQLGMITIAALVLHPLVYFTCYFCLLHSPRHLLETAEQLGMTSLWQAYRATLATVMVTLLLAAAAFATWHGVPGQARLLRTVFIGLAALTVPHMLLDQFAQRRAAQYPPRN